MKNVTLREARATWNLPLTFNIFFISIMYRFYLILLYLLDFLDPYVLDVIKFEEDKEGEYSFLVL